MKKYKLIKEYFGSPKLGTIIKLDQVVDFTYYSVDFFGRPIKIDSYIIEDTPEYWEEVVKKDYEILSFINDEGLIWNKGRHGRFDAKFQMYRPTEEEALKELNTKIHSVKRLSDGEIFTVLDKIRHKNNVANRDGIIKEFHIMSNGIWFRCDNYDIPICFVQEKLNKKPLFTAEDGVDIYEGDNYFLVSKGVVVNKYYINTYRACEKGLWSIGKDIYLFAKIDNANDFIKNNQKLFTTEDGVDIFEGDNYEVVNKITFFTHSCTCDKYSSIKEKDFIKFSTKKAAEEYILLNKPCLSYKDVQEYLKIRDVNKVFELVREKLR